VPTYQYACTECSHSFEQFQSFSDDALTVCPQCEGRLRKVYNAVGVVFKGSGFYRTDSRRDGASATSGGDANGSGNDSSKGASETSGGSSSGGSETSGSGSASTKTSTGTTTKGSSTSAA
jgi:putative FmdB family regulatory protein